MKKINTDILNNEKFCNAYYKLLTNRITHSSMSIEEDLGNADDSKNAISLIDYMYAFEKLLDLLPLEAKINEKLIIEIANKINESSIYISNGYRKIGKYLAESEIPISEPENIEDDLHNLLSKYNNDWKSIDPFEREARFHIEFIKIHPFEDGNGRTSRLLLNYFLLKEGIPPVIITPDLTKYYYSYIEEDNIEGMKNLFEIQSSKENNVINKLYDEYLKIDDMKKR